MKWSGCCGSINKTKNSCVEWGADTIKSSIQYRYTSYGNFVANCTDCVATVDVRSYRIFFLRDQGLNKSRSLLSEFFYSPPFYGNTSLVVNVIQSDYSINVIGEYFGQIALNSIGRQGLVDFFSYPPLLPIL